MTNTALRSTHTTRVVLKYLLEQRKGATVYGYAIHKATGVKPGTLYPILTRLEDHGWVASEWETLDASAEGRPPRRLYALTPLGVKQARTMLIEAGVRDA